MNQPDRYSRFVLPEGTTKVTYQSDTKLEHAATFSFMQEDHTMGNLLRMQLHLDKATVFAGYRIPHPLDAKMVVKVQTNGSKSPVQAIDNALEDLRSEVQCMITGFENEFYRQAQLRQKEAAEDAEKQQQQQQ